MQAPSTAPISIRALKQNDLDAVVAIDSEIAGRSRRAYFERRVAAALREPALHAQFAATDDKGLAGYILAREAQGEFGRMSRGYRFEIVGVRPDVKGRGIGSQLMSALVDEARRRGADEIRTTAAWNSHEMTRWLDAVGFELAPNHIVDCAVDASYKPSRDDAVSAPEGHGPGHEINYAGGQGNDYEKLARDVADVRSMKPADLHEIVRIDRAITGHDRAGYIKSKLGEAMDDSGIRVSLTARQDDAIVGFLMARVDLGDFGRTEPVAVLDIIGVDPGYGRRGIGRALISQLFANLGALHVERVETSVAPRDIRLLGLLYGAGFTPSQRLPFVRRIG